MSAASQPSRPPRLPLAPVRLAHARSGAALRGGAARRRATLAAALALAILLAGCGSAAPGRPLSLPARLPAANGSHVAVIVLENREIGEVIGNPEAPYLNRLAHRYALATGYYGVTHPSLPNYLALTGGSTFGIGTDCTSCSVSQSNIVDQLEAAHISWRAYMEGMPHPCYRGAEAAAGGYAKKHDPFMYYDDVAGNAARCAKIVPYGRLGAALRTGSLPTFVWITPNLCDDAHNCDLAPADRFLQSVLPALTREIGPHGAIFITFDEGTSNLGCCGGQAAGGRVATIAIGPQVKRGARVGVPYDHYSLLGTVERMLGLPLLRGAGSRQTSLLAAMFQGGRLPSLRRGGRPGPARTHRAR